VVTITDLPHAEAQAQAQAHAHARGWVQSGQHVDGLAAAHMPHLVSQAVFNANVTHAFVDMNAIPKTFQDYDFCWSTCAMEYLGSIERGLAFVKNALATLRPSGLGVHTMEFNVEADGPTIDNWVTVLFQRKHLEALATDLRARGHYVAAFNFDAGTQPMDQFIDIPPWPHDLPPESSAQLGNPYHLKVGIDGFVSTCFGIIIIKAA